MKGGHIVYKEWDQNTLYRKQEHVLSERRKESKTESIQEKKTKINNRLFCEDVNAHVTCVNMFNGLQVRLPAGG